ncbi:MAG: prepilin-type N-terminal cleavage/methylation domain-containing protein [Gammaproteobacteria bacterium]|nr:prepilin-type N-terminal cleavage/methylation domain-containing protein [Gammaproteobacteria bacterium]MBU1481560.1 prepilin-type N-terminal cleavage/methylation domain-containing protein [Gammaproteobacteria bacterium]
MKAHRGFTLLELIIVISIISVLAGLFLQRVPLNQELAEKAAMEQVAGAVQSALVMRYGVLMTRGMVNEKELKALKSGNPMEWLQRKPPNYAGEFFDPAPQAIPPGQWFYDLKSRDLVYAVDHAEYFTPAKDGRKWIRFHVKFEYEHGAGNTKSGKEVAATLFQPVDPYHWLE